MRSTVDLTIGTPDGWAILVFVDPIFTIVAAVTDEVVIKASTVTTIELAIGTSMGTSELIAAIAAVSDMVAAFAAEAPFGPAVDLAIGTARLDTILLVCAVATLILAVTQGPLV